MRPRGQCKPGEDPPEKLTAVCESGQGNLHRWRSRCLCGGCPWVLASGSGCAPTGLVSASSAKESTKNFSIPIRTIQTTLQKMGIGIDQLLEKEVRQ